MEKPPRRIIELEGAQSSMCSTWVEALKKLETILISEFLKRSYTEDASKARQLLESTNWDVNQALLVSVLLTVTDKEQLACPPSNNHEPVVVNFFNNDYLTRSRKRSRSLNRKSGWESSSSSSGHQHKKKLGAMFRPPQQLNFVGTLEEAKNEAQSANRWLLVNIQSISDFNSHLLNRDVWSNEAVSEIIRTNFVFWQDYNDTVEGLEVMAYYKVDSLPAILVIHPVTGQMMRSWFGRVVDPEALLEALLLLMDKTPTSTADRT